jgi:2-oxoglutarate dehydrogenase E1 component
MSAYKNKIFQTTSFLSKSNSSYIEEMYEKFCSSPNDVPDSWRQYFDGITDNHDIAKKENSGVSWAPKKMKSSSDIDPDVYEKFIPQNLTYSVEQKIKKENPTSSTLDIESSTKDSVRAIMMIRAYRIRGHLNADLDPLQLIEKEYASELDPKTYGFSEDDLNKKIFLDEVLGLKYATLKEILEILNRTYCSNIGFEFMHMTDPNEKSWIQSRIEGKDKEIHFTDRGKKAILNRLIEAEGFEKYLAKKYVGTKRFGLDGCESLIPAMEQIIKRGGALGCKEVKIGMPHRGRLNILTNVIQKPLKKIFKEFAGDPGIASGGVSGDVKYHLGASANREFDGNLVHVSLTANPSHLEAVNPVVLGQTRAKQDYHKDQERNKVIPILLHGDAAFAGQGIVAECFAMSGLTGHNIGGTIHIIVNNQIGFTTQPEFSRSSPYPSEVAKMVQAPIFHVNGDDPEAVTYCAKVATEFRQEFKRDVVIDIFCYRKFGHNEGDEPSFTQPIMYKKIKDQVSTLEQYGKKLIKEGTLTVQDFEEQKKDYQKKLDEEFEASKNYKSNEYDWFTGVWSKFTSELGQDRRGVTGIDIEKIKSLGRKLNSIPTNFKAHKTISRIFENRIKMLDTGKDFDWAMAETLALGSISDEGYGVRLVGQDSVRGTFSHRHAGINDQVTGQRYFSIKNLSANQGKVEIIDSLLSEMGVLGFEYGYSLTDPDTLVLWEAQFGDFANGAQVIFDQFISSGEKKWTRASGLVLLLPHGYEGQGPEHSSARIERYLQACAQENIQVVNCTTPANYFHALRRQIHRPFRKPLVIFTPKSLLRHKRCISEIEDFTKDNSFHRVLSDKAEYKKYNMIPLEKDEKIERVILCSGKIYYDLVDAREKLKANKVQIVRIEQLYPFPAKTLARHLSRFSNAKKFVWCQEEPQNMGCWNHVERYIVRTLDYLKAKSKKVIYTGRSPSASPATGYLKKHLAQQQEIVTKAITI